MATKSKLVEPLKIGDMTLKHRIVMAPLTRFRASDSHVPLLPMVKEYYVQRACVPGTLLITEATFISPQASGYANVPGLFEPAQLKAWKEVTDAVHAKGSFIFCQLWALGRAASKDELAKNGLDVVSSSAVPISQNSSMPRELKEAEIEQLIKDYANAAKAAVEIAGFDGVEIHGANGYLVDQFTQDVVNQRTDRWGGSIENRSRFAIEVAKAVTAAVGSHRTGIRLSPWSTFQAMKMEDPVPQFTHLIKGLREFSLAYLHLVESRVQGIADVESSDRLDFAVDAWADKSPVLLAGGFTAKSAMETVDSDYKDHEIGIVFGRHFISTPDLAFRIINGVELNPYNRNTFYKKQSEEGYTDYPFSAEFIASSEARL